MSCRSFVALTLFALTAGAASADVPSPSTEGPVTGGLGQPFVSSTSFDLALVGYEQAEYFISGTARAFTNTAPLGPDGKWSVTPGTTADYKTRILVYRPSKPAKFSGTVVVEWLNVSGGLDAAPDWTGAHVELIREGAAWVGVSAQRVGVEGGGALLAVVDLPLKKVDPARYGTLVHPGDSFSYDIFSQAAQAVLHPSGTSPLGPLKVRKLLAAGESQSAFRLAIYVDAIDPLAALFDGFLIHSRGSIPLAGLSEPPQPAIPVPAGSLIRSDVRVPVLDVQTETDLTFLDSFSTRQNDSDRFRLWEIAGTSHADAYLLVTGGADLGKSPDIANLTITTTPVPGIITCGLPINSGPQHFVLGAAFAALDRWVRTGKAPAHAPRLDVAAGPPRAIVRDEHGNGTGGIRTPQLDVPIATFTGEQSGPIICRLLGTTTPFDAATLKRLYPTHHAFLSAFSRAIRRAEHAGFLLAPDARLLRRWAARSDVGK